MTTWNNITKASGTSWSKIASAAAGSHSGESSGNPIGLLLALTYTIAGTKWVDVAKASGTSWTKINKAT